MIFEAKDFYQSYLKDYHYIKAKYLKGMLDNLSKSEIEFFGKELLKEDKDNFRLTLKSELRQTYFHAIETFFELLFALNPIGKSSFDDENIQIYLTNSNWTENYKKIKEIAQDDKKLDFLNSEINFAGKIISVGHYLFYMGIFPNAKIPSELFEQIKVSLNAIIHGIKLLALDFINKEEYNAYKHGLRIIPSVSHIYFLDAETMEKKIDFDSSDSMSFYIKSKNESEIKIITKVFDVERDFQMISFCSNLINNLIFYRRISMKLKCDENKYDKIPIIIFEKDKIDSCNNVNIPITEIKYEFLNAK